MTLPLETSRPDQLRVLVLTPHHVDFLWLEALLRGAPELDPDATWCPDLIDCDDLIRNARFDVIVWDCAFHSGSESSFLQYLDRGQRRQAGAGAERGLARCSGTVVAGRGRGGLPVSPAAGPLGFRPCGQVPVVPGAPVCLGPGPAWRRRGLRHHQPGPVLRPAWQQALLRAERNGQRLALLDLNVDDFRSINESFGYQKSDQLMVKLAERLRHALRRVDSLMRIGRR